MAARVPTSSGNRRCGGCFRIPWGALRRLWSAAQICRLGSVRVPVPLTMISSRRCAAALRAEVEGRKGGRAAVGSSWRDRPGSQVKRRDLAVRRGLACTAAPSSRAMSAASSRASRAFLRELEVGVPAAQAAMLPLLGGHALGERRSAGGGDGLVGRAGRSRHIARVTVQATRENEAGARREPIPPGRAAEIAQWRGRDSARCLARAGSGDAGLRQRPEIEAAGRSAKRQ